MNITKQPVISVIIPVYNAEKYLNRCLDSVINQHFSDIEIICINDGSTDNSLNILQKYASKDSRIYIINQKNCGVANARNKGLDIAKGKFISFVDCDDAVDKNIYETLLEQNTDNVDAICFSAYEIDEYKSHKVQTNSTYFDGKFSGLVTLHDNDILNISSTVWNKIFLRDNIESVSLRFPDGLYYEDNAFVLNYFSLFKNVIFINNKLYYYYRHKNSIMDKTKTKYDKISFNYIYILDDIYSFWSRNNILPHKQAVFEHICIFMFRAAVSICNEWETSGIVYILGIYLHKWNISPEDKILKCLKYGNYNIQLRTFPRREVTMLKPLKGLEKIFYIGNCRNKRVCYLFSIKIASWKRPH